MIVAAVIINKRMPLHAQTNSLTLQARRFLTSTGMGMQTIAAPSMLRGFVRLPVAWNSKN